MNRKGITNIQAKFIQLRKRKNCKFCKEGIEYIDYKDVKILSSYVTERARIPPRRVTGNCAFHQRQLTVAIKRARIMALLPFVAK